MKKIFFTQMLVVLHVVGFARYVTTGDNLNKRYLRWKKRFEDALAIKNDSGAGLTEAELAKRITWEKKLEKLCPHFEQMLILYGKRANINLPALGILVFPGHDLVYRDDRDKEEDDDENKYDDDNQQGRHFFPLGFMVINSIVVC